MLYVLLHTAEFATASIPTPRCRRATCNESKAGAAKVVVSFGVVFHVGKAVDVEEYRDVVGIEACGVRGVEWCVGL